LLGGSLSSKGRAFAGASKALPASAGPSQRIASDVGYGNDRIVEGRFDVHNAFRDCTPFTATPAFFAP